MIKYSNHTKHMHACMRAHIHTHTKKVFAHNQKKVESTCKLDMNFVLL